MLRSRRLRFLLVAATLATLGGSGAAAAAWAITSSGSGYAKALVMPTVGPPSRSLSYPNVVLSWSAATIGGSAVDSYTARRYSDSGALQTVGAGCSGPITATSCTEANVPVGRWQYTLQAVKASWSSSESPKTAVVEIAAAPTSVSCTSCRLFGSTRYINAAGKAAVSIQVSLPASSLASDSVHLTLTDSASHTLTATSQAAPAGAGTLSFSGLDTSSFADGSVTASAWVTADTGDASPTTQTTLIRDTVAPTATNIQTANGGGTASKIDASGDTMTYSFSEPIDPASIVSGWSGSSTTVTATVANTNPDTISVTAANLGSVNTGTSFATAAISCPTSTLSMSGSAVTLTLNSCAPTNKLKTGTSSTFTWSPSTSATDQAGNPMASNTASESGGPKTNF